MRQNFKLLFSSFLMLVLSSNSIFSANITIDDVPDSLYISEFRADANLTAVLELYNGDSDTIWLKNFSVVRRQGSNGSASMTYNFPDNAYLLSGECYMILSSNYWHPEAVVNAADTIHNIMYGFRDGAYYLELNYINVPEGETPIVVDQVLTNQGHQGVGGVANATKTSFIIRKFTVKRGNPDFATSSSSEWFTMDLPNNNAWRDGIGFTSVYSNHGDFHISTSPEEGVIINNSEGKISVPYGYWRQDYFVDKLNPGLGMGWEYYTYGDTSSILAQTGDKLTLFAFGNEMEAIEYDIEVQAPSNSYAATAPYGELMYNEETGESAYYFGPYEWPVMDGDLAYYRYNVTDLTSGVMDTIGGILPKITNSYYTSYEPRTIPFATRVDTLLKYIDIPESCTYNFTWVDGVERIDLKYGDILNITSKDGKTTRPYFLNIVEYEYEGISSLDNVTWPDKPQGPQDLYYENQGWKGDTVPAFSSSINTYYISIYPSPEATVPAFSFETSSPKAQVSVDRAFNLIGNYENRTTKVTVTAEDGTTTKYAFVFQLASLAGDEPFIAEPIFTQQTFRHNNTNHALEISNPGNQQLDLSNYMIVSEEGGASTPAKAISTPRNGGYYGFSDHGLYTKFIPGCKWDSSAIYVNSGINRAIDDNDAVNHVLPAGGSFLVMSTDFRPTTNASWAKFPDEIMSHPYLLEFPSVNSPTTNAWGEKGWNWPTGPSRSNKGPIYLFKILSDSVKTGLKDAMDPNDFLLVDCLGPSRTGGVWIFEAGSENNPNGVSLGSNNNINVTTIIRKPEVFTGTTEGVTLTTNPSFGSNTTESEWYWYGNHLDENYENYVSDQNASIFYENLGKHSFDPVTVYQSVIGAKQDYLVSPGHTRQTIAGVVTGTTASQFFAKVDTLNPGQTMLLYHAGSEQKDMSYILKNADSLVVVSADKKNSTTYTITVTDAGLDNNTNLESNASLAVVNNTAATVTVDKSTTVAELIETISTSSSSSQLYVMLEKANVPTQVRGVDMEYVPSILVAGMEVEVIAQDASSKRFAIVINSDVNDAYIVSSVFDVKEDIKSVSGVTLNISVGSLLDKIYGATGATVSIVDHLFFDRTFGTVRLDDQIKVVSKDGQKTVYYQVTMVGEKDPEASTLKPVQGLEHNYSIYPNPTDGLFIIKGDLSNSIITTFSVQGKIVNRVIKPTHNSVDLSLLNTGIYYVVISNIDGGHETHKVIKY